MDQARTRRLRSWMLQPSNMRVVRECRKTIQLEFQITLRIDDNLLLERIVTFSERSTNAIFVQKAQMIQSVLSNGAIDQVELDLSVMPIIQRNRR